MKKKWASLFVTSLSLTGSCGWVVGTATSTCDVQISTSNDSSSIGIQSEKDLSAKVAQSVEFDQDVTISSLTLRLLRVGSPTGTLTLVIETDSSDSPSNDPIFMSDGTSNSATLSVSSISATDSADYTFTFANTVTFQAERKYWITVEGSYTKSDSDYISWILSASDTYTDGTPKLQNSSNLTWQDSSVSNTDLGIQIGCT